MPKVTVPGDSVLSQKPILDTRSENSLSDPVPGSHETPAQRVAHRS